MANTAVIVPDYDLKNGIRKVGATNILNQGIEDMIEEVKADSLKLVLNAEGTRYVHILNSETGEYFSVKVGKSVTSKKKGAELIADLVENHVVYCGTTENGTWFTFGNVGTTGEAEAEISLKDLMKKKVKFYAG